MKPKYFTTVSSQSIKPLYDHCVLGCSNGYFWRCKLHQNQSPIQLLNCKAFPCLYSETLYHPPFFVRISQ